MKKSTGPIEILLVIIIAAILIIPHVVGETTVNDLSAKDRNGYPSTSKTLDDFNKPGLTFGTNSVTDVVDGMKKRYPDGDFKMYDTLADGYAALATGNIDGMIGFMDMRSQLAVTFPQIAYIEEPVLELDFGFATQKTDKGKALCEELNTYIKQIKENGELDRLTEKWANADGDLMDDYNYTGEKGNLRVVTGGLWVPMTFYASNKLTGEFVEIICGFCASSGYTPKFESAAFNAELMGLASGSYDIMADSVIVSEERKEKVNITDPFMTDYFYLVVPADVKEKEVSRLSVFLEGIQQSIRNNFIAEARYAMLLKGLGITILLALFSGLSGTILGGFICFIRTRDHRLLSAIASLYVRVFRGIPIVVLLLIFYYIVFSKSGVSAFWVCVVAFSLDFGAYCAEIFRSGIGAVPIGQSLAGRALGFGRRRTFSKIVWPQALRHILPVYSGQLIAMVKTTAIAGYISVIDLTKASDLIRARTFDPFFPLFFTAIIYFMLSAVMLHSIRALIRHIEPGIRSVDKEILSAVKAFDAEKEREIGINNVESGLPADGVLIKTEHLCKSFGNVTPVKDISCEIKKGEVISVIGSSGTGKSTFLNLLNHLEEADSGSIIFEGENTGKKGYDINRLHRKIGMVFQSFHLFSHLTVIENLMFPQTEVLGRSKEEACRKGMELLRLVGLEDKALGFPGQLSGGEQQRVAIMRAVAMDPHVILFDEPTSALDPTMVGEVLTVIQDLARRGMTMVIVTHELRFAKEISSRVFYLDEGTIYEEGSPAQIFDSPTKEKTRQFINHLKVLYARLGSISNDYRSLVIQLEQYGFRQMISRSMINRMLTITEELGVNTILPGIGNKDIIDIVYEYNNDEKEEMNIRFTYYGEDRNPFDSADAVSLALIRNACSSYSYDYKDGKCIVKSSMVL